MPAKQDASLTQHTISVLLVDDQAMVAEAVKRMLASEQDIEFHYCQDPTKAIAKALEINPTVILQDLVMPDVDGLTLVKFYRGHKKLKDVPLIVLSTREEATTKAEAFALGANDYLVKLPDKIELIARIRYHSGGYINLLQRNEAFEALKASQAELAAQLEHASEYVVSILPEPLTEGEITTDWKFVPSAQLGGDSFGYHRIDQDRFAIYLLDVCDHGVGPALLSVSAINQLRSENLHDVDFSDPSSVMEALNETYQMELHNDLYFTIWYGVFDRRDMSLKFSSGGHPPALLMSPGGEIQELLTKNPMVGGFPDFPYVSDQVEVTKGDRLFVYSDGVYEVSRPDGSMWDFEGFKRFMSEAPDGEEIGRLLAEVRAMHQADVLEDDFSMLKVSFAS